MYRGFAVLITFVRINTFYTVTLDWMRRSRVVLFFFVDAETSTSRSRGARKRARINATQVDVTLRELEILLRASRVVERVLRSVVLVVLERSVVFDPRNVGSCRRRLARATRRSVTGECPEDDPGFNGGSLPPAPNAFLRGARV